MSFERSQGLYTKHVISQSDYDQAVADFKSASAKVDQTRAQLDQLAIKAPLMVKLGLRQVSVGDFISSGASLVNLQSIDPIYADFSYTGSLFKTSAAGQSCNDSIRCIP